MVGRPINCAMVYVNATTTWQQWENPWIDTDHNPDNDWLEWVHAPGTDRQLVITQNLFPSSVDDTDWLDGGAAGDFTSYAQTFAQNLVNAGLGNSIIRLAPEMNGTWMPYSLGSTPVQWAKWIQFWRNTVFAMRSVPGANFEFDWCVNDLYRNLPLSQIYPGNDVVDIIGMDVYDDGNLGSTGSARWNSVLNGNDGVQALVNFAQAQGKPISFPEWGVDDSAEGGGDDPAFVNGIASIVANYPTAYQSYFYKYGDATQLAPGTQSLAAYINDFGANGFASGSRGASAATATSTRTTTSPTPPATTATGSSEGEVPPAGTGPVTVTGLSKAAKSPTISTRAKAGIAKKHTRHTHPRARAERRRLVRRHRRMHIRRHRARSRP